jgi:plasmid stabilization system protein ParE
MAMICEPMQLLNLLVVTSEFHLARSRLIFDWIVPLWIPEATVAYIGAVDAGLDGELLEGRREKERGGCVNVESQSRKFTTKMSAVAFLMQGHGAYNSAPQQAASASTAANMQVLGSY